MSSVAMSTSGCRRRTAPNACSSALEYAAPVGFDGLFSMKSRVFGVITASSCAGVIL